MDSFYEDAGSLFVKAYDAFYAADLPQISGDVRFYLDLARRCGGNVLELGCGTGRVTLPLAQAGLTVTAVDASQGMLAVAREKAAAQPPDVRQRLTLLHQDMCALNLEGTFDLIFIPFRSFQHLLTVELQRQALQGLRRHLAPRGRFALHLFDPRLDLLVDSGTPPAGMSSSRDDDGRHYIAEVLRTHVDHLAQTRRDLWRYTEIGADGQILSEDTREMALRWTYRWELRHLLATSGFHIEAEYSDFAGAIPVYGRELILVAGAN